MDIPKNIKIDWGDKHKTLNYKFEDLNTGVTVPKEWNVGNSRKIFQNLEIGIHRFDHPYEWMNCVTQEIEKLSLTSVFYCVHCLTPGNFLPRHSDTFEYYAKANNVVDINRIVRIIIFLDDAEPGQFLHVDNEYYTDYKKGDVAYWTGGTPHLAANLSTVNRYTMQITGILNEK